MPRGSLPGDPAKGWPGGEADGQPAIRLDKWLWQARFFKSRSLAARAVEAGMRINGARVSKPALILRPGDVVTFTQARAVRVVRMLAPGLRRGPASEARGLYEDLSPPPAGADEAE